MEKKLLQVAEIKLAPDGERGFSGYGAVFNNTDAVGDVILKGAFAATIAGDPLPLMFLNHDPRSLPIGRWTKLEEDEAGLRVEGEFLDTNTGRDAYTAAKAGAITGLSIGYRVEDSAILPSGLRNLTKIRLLEISVVTFPCNDLARITDVKTADAFERGLLNVGMTLEEAKSFLANHQSHCETKYHEAAVEVAALNLLSKLQGEK